LGNAGKFYYEQEFYDQGRDFSVVGKMKSLVKKLIAPVVLATALFFSPVKADAQTTFTINSFAQPQDSTLEYYGSGDVDSNNVQDWNDHNLISQGIQNDQADIDGDGIPGTQEDAELFAKYLNGDTLLPQINWACSNMTREQRQDWVKKMLKIDKTDEIPPVQDYWMCGQYSTQTIINFHGFSELKDSTIASKFPKYNLENNGKLNLPVYQVGISWGEPIGHFINGILIGDDPLNFDDWCFFEPRFANKINIGDWDMPENSEVTVNYTFFEESGGISTPTFVKFQLNNEIPNLTDYYSGLILQRPQLDTIPPEISIFSPVPDTTYNKLFSELEYLVSDSGGSGVDSCWFSSDSGKTKI
ncbi:MAG TPA: hypothetical protein DHW42_10790, partial [Candidatus Marinimicrobia bacterium]|nr:hypothetical protein [Candidatus Neomarinimicrobiota bacterium]